MPLRARSVARSLLAAVCWRACPLASRSRLVMLALWSGAALMMAHVMDVRCRKFRSADFDLEQGGSGSKSTGDVLSLVEQPLGRHRSRRKSGKLL
jgi:hypothetical protein